MDGGQKPESQKDHDVDDEIIDLDQIVQADDEGDVIDLTDILEEQQQSDDEVIDLVDAVEPQAGGMVESDDKSADPVSGAAVDDSVDDAPMDTTPPDMNAVHAATLSAVISPPPSAEPAELTDQQVEDALQRVIEKVYSEKIEHLMIQTIKSTIKDEIEKIKAALLDDEDVID